MREASDFLAGLEDEEVTDPLDALAAAAYQNAAARRGADISSGLPSQCVIEITDIFQALGDKGLPCTEENAQLVEGALERCGFNALAASAYLEHQQPTKPN